MNDVCFILEGTYPFIRGGLSSWTHNLIEDMPDLEFALLTISPQIGPIKKFEYTIPNNVTNLVETFLCENITPKQPCPNRINKDQFWSAFYNFLTGSNNQYGQHFRELYPLLCDPNLRAVNAHDILYSRESHALTERLYEETKKDDCSFFNFFWTWRTLMLMFIQAINVEIPPAKVYHATCTGYSGLIGVLAKLKYGRPLILTEHGIYTKERKIEINQADWIQKKERSRIYIDQSQGTIKDLWTDNFYRLSRLTYEVSDTITTLYGGNKNLEIEFGADPSKIKIIPNGIHIHKYLPLRSVKKQDPNIYKIGLVGRVVPIKDIKLFIKVCKIVLNEMPNVIFQIIGPVDEDKEYFQECINLCKLLDVEHNCIFTGPKNLISNNIYPQLDIMALTSISEGLPLTILEALCVGVPCVTTDVGACKELLHGRTEEDISLGKCGYVVPIGNAEEFAQACLKILRDPTNRTQMVKTGHERIDRFYQQSIVQKQYRDLYMHYMMV